MRRALLILLLASPAYADKAPHNEGDYGGVAPGVPQKAEPSGKPAKPRRPPPKGTLTWVGFEAKGGGAQVFLQSVAPFEVEQHLEGPVLVAHLTLKRLGQNTWRTVDTRFFDNPIAAVGAKAVGAQRATKDHAAQTAGVNVRITFKNPQDAKQATVRSETGPDGMYYVYLEFPEGTAPKLPTTVVEPESK